LIAYETILMEIVSLPCRENGKLIAALPFFPETRRWLFDCRSHSGVSIALRSVSNDVALRKSTFQCCDSTLRETGAIFDNKVLK